METLAMPAINFAAIMPETILSVVAMALLLVNVFVPSEHKAYLGYLSIIGLIVAFIPDCRRLERTSRAGSAGPSCRTTSHCSSR